MKILGLSTSSKVLSISLYDDKEKLIRLHKKIGLKHSNYLISYIRKIFKSSNLELSDISLIALDIGPGSFTGLRVGVTTVKVAAKVLKFSVVGVSSLDIIAEGIENKTGRKCVVLDAKRRKVYAAFYENSDIIGDYLLLDINELTQLIYQDIIFVGDGIEKYKQIIQQNLSRKKIKFEFVSKDKWYPDSSNLIKIGRDKFNSYGTENIDKLVPMYLYSKECSIKGI